MLRESLRDRRELLADPHVDIADGAFAVGDLEAVQGNYEAAERLLLESVAIHRRLGDDRGQRLAFNLERLAILYRDLGRYDEAERMVTDATKISADAQMSRNTAASRRSRFRTQSANPVTASGTPT